MPKSFAEYLTQFALSVDIVNSDIFGELRELIQQYVKESLGVDYFEFMRVSIVDGRQGLVTLWPSDGYLSNSIKDTSGNYNGQTAYAFDKGIPLWVVDEKRLPLTEVSDYVDLWSGKTDLPKYATPGEIKEVIRTAIMIPLKDSGRTIGLLDFESSQYIGITEVAKKELRMIAESLSMLYALEQTNKIQRESTKKALQELKRTLRSKNLPRLTKPKLFLASSSRADEQVMGIIHQLLGEYDDKLNVVAWDTVSKGGNINEQIIDDILSSRYGICYFSEPATGSAGDHKFQDNPNVLIEAGMLHALYHVDSDSSDGWIPIREINSPLPPFDFIAERRLDVARTKDGELNEHKFKSELKTRINKLIDS
jgi:hypothetical protein